MKNKIIWDFKYKGIACQIVHWGLEDYPKELSVDGIWNAYIIIHKKQLPKQFTKLLCEVETIKDFKRKYWKYYKLDDYFDMHGGLTFYEVIREEFTGQITVVKVGCDYVHSWDRDYTYSESILENDLKKSVECFMAHFPNYLIRRISDGKYVKPGIEELI